MGTPVLKTKVHPNDLVHFIKNETTCNHGVSLFGNQFLRRSFPTKTRASISRRKKRDEAVHHRRFERKSRLRLNHHHAPTRFSRLLGYKRRRSDSNSNS